MKHNTGPMEGPDPDRGSARSRMMHGILDEVLRTHTYLETRPAWASLPLESRLYVGEATLHPGCGSWVRILCDQRLAQNLAQRLFNEGTGPAPLQCGRAMRVVAGCVARAFERSFDEYYHYIEPESWRSAPGTYEPRMLCSVVVEGGGILFCDHKIHRDLWPTLEE